MFPGRRFEEEVASYEAEVDAEAAELVRRGVAPWVAAQGAAETVRRRRARRAVKEDSERAAKAARDFLGGGRG